MAQLRRVIPQIRASGAEIYAIGNGSVDDLRWFIEHEKPEMKVLTDPTRAIHETAGFKREFGTVYGPRAIANVAAFALRGYKNKGAKPRGDALQQGGVLIVATDDRLLFEHVDQRWGDHASPADIVKTVQNVSSL